jgi:hypothetical protein
MGNDRISGKHEERERDKIVDKHKHINMYKYWVIHVWVNTKEIFRFTWLNKAHDRDREMDKGNVQPVSVLVVVSEVFWLDEQT